MDLPVIDARSAARRWAETWERAWPPRDAAAIADLYADDAAYRGHPLHAPVDGGARAYTAAQFAVEEGIECRFGEPIVDGDRAAIEWWASWIEEGKEITLAGTTVLRFDASGLVVEHLDYWVAGDGRVAPFEGWGAG